MARAVDFSIVIPTFNGSLTLEGLVEEIVSAFSGWQIEIVLVNDGSVDSTELVGRRIVRTYPGTAKFIQLEKNFGEHNAVLAGLCHTTGSWIGVLDDDCQNPPAELFRMWLRIRATGDDVVYGRYIRKQHEWWRNAGSWFNGLLATVLLQKPVGLYFSSFKVMTRRLVNELVKYRGSRPYLDHLIWRSTRRIGQLDVLHRSREHGQSGYTIDKLIRLSLNMVMSRLIPESLSSTLSGKPAYLIRYIRAGDNLFD